jgi:hypothetical protein
LGEYTKTREIAESGKRVELEESIENGMKIAAFNQFI